MEQLHKTELRGAWQLQQSVGKIIKLKPTKKKKFSKCHEWCFKNDYNFLRFENINN